MNRPRIALSPELFALVFPFFVAFDRHMQVIQVGEVLDRICHIKPGDRLDKHFIIKNLAISFEFDAILENDKKVFMLESSASAKKIVLKGQMLYCPDADCIIYLCSLAVQDLDSLRNYGLSISDFAIHDPVVDFLFILESVNTALSDVQMLRKQLEALVDYRTKELEELTQTLQQDIAKREAIAKELRETQNQLLQSQKMEALGVLAGGIAHDFNNILAVISGEMDLLHQQVEPGSLMREKINIIEKHVVRASEVIQKLLGFAKYEEYKSKLLSLNDIINESTFDTDI